MGSFVSQVSGFCLEYLVSSQEKLFNPSIPSLGLRNVIYINETHTR